MTICILDMGSGNTCGNNLDYVKRMIDELAEVDPKRKFIIKWQLFQKAGNNIPLKKELFDYAYCYAIERYGYQTTASVFDLESLKFLLQFDIPFVKIANKPDLYWLGGEVSRKIPIIFSWTPGNDVPAKLHSDFALRCISKYPATIKDYEEKFQSNYNADALRYVSDHTTDWQLYLKYRPKIYECHYKLKDSTGLDAGEFARIPEQIKEIYNEL